MNMQVIKNTRMNLIALKRPSPKAMKAVNQLNQMMIIENRIEDHQQVIKRNGRGSKHAYYDLEQSIDGLSTRLIKIKQDYVKENM